MSLLRIRQWHDYWRGQIYVSFSGGKDSTVLLHLVRSIYPNTLAVYFDTGMEFPEIRKFIKETFNVKWIKPAMAFSTVIEKYGYPVVSKEVSQKIYEIRTTKSPKLLNKRLCGDTNKYKSGKLPEKWKYLIDTPFKIGHQCCDIMKKRPAKKYEKKSGLKCIIGTMASDSHLRRQQYLRNGCSSYEGKIQCRPLSFWTTENVWEYIRGENIKYSSIYDMGYRTTGCIFCAFGAHREEEPNRFQLMAKTHPNLYKYCMEHLDMENILSAINIKITN